MLLKPLDFFSLRVSMKWFAVFLLPVIAAAVTSEIYRFTSGIAENGTILASASMEVQGK